MTGSQIYLLVGLGKGSAGKDDGKRPADFSFVEGYRFFSMDMSKESMFSEIIKMQLA